MGSIEKMVAHAVAIANDDSHGYSQADRWNVDRDCSSLMYDSADAGGFPVGRGPDRTRYTGTMLADFTAAGFEAIPFSRVGLGGLMRGDVLLNTRHHTEMYIGGGQMVGAHIAETGDVYGEPGDQTGNEISVCAAYVYWAGWEWVLRPKNDESEDDDMRPADVWEYDYKGSAPGGNMYNCMLGMNAKLDALTAAVEVLADAKGVDSKAVVKAVDKAVRDKLAKIKVSVSQ